MTAFSSISAHDDGTTTVVVLAGEIDAALRGQAIGALAAVVTGGRPVVLDLHGVTFLDSSGVRFLLQCRRACDRAGLTCTLQGVPPRAMHVLDVLGLRGFLGLPAAHASATVPPTWTTEHERAALPPPALSTQEVCAVLRRQVEAVLGTPVAVCATADVDGEHRLLGELSAGPRVPGEHRAAWLPGHDGAGPTAAAVTVRDGDLVVCVSLRSAVAVDWEPVADPTTGSATLLAAVARAGRPGPGLVEHYADLGRRVASRAVVDQATGVIMARDRCSEAEASATLRAASRHGAVRLDEVAAQVVGEVGVRPAGAARTPLDPATTSGSAPSGPGVP